MPIVEMAGMPLVYVEPTIDFWEDNTLVDMDTNISFWVNNQNCKVILHDNQSKLWTDWVTVGLLINQRRDSMGRLAPSMVRMMLIPQLKLYRELEEILTHNHVLVLDSRYITDEHWNIYVTLYNQFYTVFLTPEYLSEWVQENGRAKKIMNWFRERRNIDVCSLQF